MGNFYKRILDNLDRIKGDNVTWEELEKKAQTLNKRKFDCYWPSFAEPPKIIEPKGD